MTLEKFQGWMSLLANLGVMIGLFLLILELDQSREQAASAAYQDRISAIESSLQSAASSEYLPEIYVKLEQVGIGGLTPVELYRLRTWEFAREVRIIGQITQYERGFLDEASYSAAVNVVNRNIALWNELGLSGDDPALQRVIEN